ncbi:aldehyde dehydrogenase family protein [Ramlibacter albus]|uniref:L-glutamate gamma-semialdehyde dehydrogenase n=1 Tax=Ramlibacter albus TaxID=2079448 RepID=A0A923S5N5_9BURK|nr:aldehyde dehydrogenase family protein [Ramlibacter albus]MBC5768188.1 aldehyde dehydrogenase family protein [Ramlibacter albus]
MTQGAFELTYASMYQPPQELHDAFESALKTFAADGAQEHPLWIAGKPVHTEERLDKRSPADLDTTIGRFSVASLRDADAAMAAATGAARSWGLTPWRERVAIIRRAQQRIQARMYEIAVAVSREVGKNRVEALAEVAEVVDFCKIYCAQMEAHEGFDRVLPSDPVPGMHLTNRSVMRPYGVWVVIAPFNYPFALAAGPSLAALVAGNAVVLKGSLATPWSGVLLAECLHEAGVPAGVFNNIVGDGPGIGAALVTDDRTGGVTFTGSHAVGRGILAHQASRFIPRPCITEMGGKNSAIVLPGADLDAAAKGVARSAFGMGGQKCSALSRVFVHEDIADDLIGRVAEFVKTLVIGDPLERGTFAGPLATENGYRNFGRYCEQLAGSARIVMGGHKPDMPRRGQYVANTLAEADASHPLWSQELFCPILLVGRVKSRDEAMQRANAVPYGLTAGFFGAEEDIPWFMDNIEAGVTFANRSLGATTGAWPGYQPFGGWKASGNTGKGLASFYYLPQYMREQSRTIARAS